MSQVDPATISVWRWQALLLALIAAFGTTILASIGGGPLWLLPLGILSIGVPAVWVLSARYYRNLEFSVDDNGITIHRGLLWHSDIALPRARIQHTDVAQGPLQRRYGVSTLKLYTAGSRYTKIELPGLAHAEALALRDSLISRDGSGV